MYDHVGNIAVDKQLAWRSVHIPMIMPKPKLTALTGGYRKTPVLQIGADIYCDTALMSRQTGAAGAPAVHDSSTWPRTHWVVPVRRHSPTPQLKACGT